ncbi:MAG: thioredoxin family protein [Bacteroidota bacterium]
MFVDLKLIYFASKSCSVCISLLPKLEQMITQNYPQITLTILEIEENLKECSEYGVYSAPSLILFVDNKENHRWVRNFGLFEVEQKLIRIISLIS